MLGIEESTVLNHLRFLLEIQILQQPRFHTCDDNTPEDDDVYHLIFI